jgi:hypothetical protein
MVNLGASFEQAQTYLSLMVGIRPTLVVHALRALPAEVTRPLLDWMASLSGGAPVVVLSDQRIVTSWARRIPPEVGALTSRGARNQNGGPGRPMTRRLLRPNP